MGPGAPATARNSAVFRGGFHTHLGSHRGRGVRGAVKDRDGRRRPSLFANVAKRETNEMKRQLATSAPTIV
jgi:hypothetical protein